MKGENQPHKNVGAMPPCSPEKAKYKENTEAKKTSADDADCADGRQIVCARIFLACMSA